MTPSAYEAWKSNERLRDRFELVLDTAQTPYEHTGYVCKSCWVHFPAKMDLLKLLVHASEHERRDEAPYPKPPTVRQ
jgi:hypothetical protein